MNDTKFVKVEPVKEEKKFSNRSNGTYTIQGKQYPSVTTILQAISKPALINWACKMGWEIGAKAKTSVELFEKFRKISDDAKTRGSDAHTFIDNYFKINTPLPSVEQNEYVFGFKKFLVENKVKPLHVEFQLHSNKYKYAGTCDFHGIINDVEYIVDFKTNKYGRVYPDVELQVNAYSNATHEMGLTDTVLPTMCVAISPKGYSVKVWKENPIQLFLNVYEVWKWMHPDKI